jgi:murein tripeptide amidase MpaA
MTNPYVSPAATLRPDRFYRFAELSAILQDLAARHPQLAALSSIGKSHEGRDLWCMTLTNQATGPHHEKPAYFIDANIHAGEITGSAVALETIRHLLEDRDADPRARRLLDEMTVYVVPRVSPDGAEAYMTGPDAVRSSTRAWPPGPEKEGLRPQDLDGDGQILVMRVPDPHGAFKVSDADPRLMVPRAPDEAGGAYYWLLPEGLLTNHRPGNLIGEIALAPRSRGLDLNRNWPSAWAPEAEQPGAGPYPLSEPETRAIADFMLAHPNIAGSQHYHTFSGVILRPSSRRTDSDLDPADLRRYQVLGDIGEAETGYRTVSLYHEFTENKKKLYPGMLIDWAYDQLGLMTFSTELWSVGLHLGLEVDNPLDYYFRHSRPPADELKLLAYVDDELGGVGFKAWTPYEHPQLGPVEIGGWQYKLLFQNAPGPALPDVVRRNTAFTVRAALASPRVRLRETAVTALGGGLFRVEAVVENQGFLPTSSTAAGAKMKAVPPDRLELAVGPGCTLVEGQSSLTLGFLAGRDEQYQPARISGGYALQNRRKASWIVRADVDGAAVAVTAISQRGGVDRADLTLA